MLSIPYVVQLFIYGCGGGGWSLTSTGYSGRALPAGVTVWQFDGLTSVEGMNLGPRRVRVWSRLHCRQQMFGSNTQ